MLFQVVKYNLEDSSINRSLAIESHKNNSNNNFKRKKKQEHSLGKLHFNTHKSNITCLIWGVWVDSNGSQTLVLTQERDLASVARWFRDKLSQQEPFGKHRSSP